MIFISALEALGFQFESQKNEFYFLISSDFF